MVASQPPGRRASAALATRTAGSIQWKAVAARTRSNGSDGSGQSSKAAVTTSTVGNRARLRRATAARWAPSSTATIWQPRPASGMVAWPVPGPISRTREPGPMPVSSTRSSNRAGGYRGRTRSYSSAAWSKVDRSRSRSPWVMNQPRLRAAPPCRCTPASPPPATRWAGGGSAVRDQAAVWRQDRLAAAGGLLLVGGSGVLLGRAGVLVGGPDVLLASDRGARAVVEALPGDALGLGRPGGGAAAGAGPVAERGGPRAGAGCGGVPGAGVLRGGRRRAGIGWGLGASVRRDRDRSDGRASVGGAAGADAVGGVLGAVAFGDGVGSGALGGVQLLADVGELLAQAGVVTLELIDPALGVAAAGLQLLPAGAAGTGRAEGEEQEQGDQNAETGEQQEQLAFGELAEGPVEQAGRARVGVLDAGGGDHDQEEEGEQQEQDGH